MFLNDIKYNWIGDIPKNWEVKRIKNLFYLKKEISENPEQEQVLSLTMKGIIKRDVSSNEGQLPDTYKGYTKIYPDDIVMNPMDLRSGWIDRSKYDGIISPSYYVLNKLYNDLDIGFFNYQLQRHYKERIFFSFGQGVSYDYRWGLGRETVLNFPIIVPPLEIQTQIVLFLDNKTQKIDELIDKTEQKIKLLKEKRTSLINHCITKGLNPNAEMKDSGVEWIGEIPKNWEIKKLKHLINKDGFIRGPFGSSLKIEFFVSDGYKVYAQKNAIYSNLSLGESFINEEKFQELSRFKIIENDILMSCSGTIGKTTLVPKDFKEGIINQALMIIRLSNFEDISPKYLQKIMTSHFFETQIIDNSKGGAMKNLVGIDIFKNIKIPIQPLEEQNRILEYFDKQSQKIDCYIEKETQRIELLKEYRQSLISDVVTGKIDVRDWNK